MYNGNQLGLLDLIEIFNLGLQIYDIKLNKDDIVTTVDRLKRIEEQNKEILKILKDKQNDIQ